MTREIIMSEVALPESCGGLLLDLPNCNDDHFHLLWRWAQSKTSCLCQKFEQQMLLMACWPQAMNYQCVEFAVLMLLLNEDGKCVRSGVFDLRLQIFSFIARAPDPVIYEDKALYNNDWKRMDTDMSPNMWDFFIFSKIWKTMRH